METGPAFVEFYEKNNISPVSQNISNIELHFQRRESLYRSLGVLPRLIKGAKVLEFGPGSGHNALYTASLAPQCYELVEGNSRGATETRQRLSAYPNISLTVHQTLFTEFRSDTQFDMVWAEGCLPHQTSPLAILEHISSFVAEGGVLVVSTASGLSYLSETLRRLFRDRFFDPNEEAKAQARRLAGYFSTHLAHLHGMSRPVEDWVLDSIVQPLASRKMLGIPEVIQALADRFESYGSSPQWRTDWRWYKDIVGPDRGFNERMLTSYFKHNLNFLDYRFEFREHSVAFGEELESYGDKSWDVMCKIEQGDDNSWGDFFSLMEELCAHIYPVAPETTLAIEDIVSCLKTGHPNMELKKFSQWWGRGQQYLSLVKSSNYSKQIR